MLSHNRSQPALIVVIQDGAHRHLTNRTGAARIGLLRGYRLHQRGNVESSHDRVPITDAIMIRPPRRRINRKIAVLREFLKYRATHCHASLCALESTWLRGHAPYDRHTTGIIRTSKPARRNRRISHGSSQPWVEAPA
jgi:hypothetical protein